MRPDQPKLLDNDADPAILTLMSECWRGDPNLRPDISTVLKRLRQQNKGKYVLRVQAQKIIREIGSGICYEEECHITCGLRNNIEIWAVYFYRLKFQFLHQTF